ncbi:MAG: IreB family regulatory phosphoprotein [Lachnospiraceae bacterium]|nr:IreB family regulatory phosphoprotein [Lachnospiraceae bacterium]
MDQGTQFFKVENTSDDYVRSVIGSVYVAMSEKGYNPVSQMVGYLMSGDPTYITNHLNARAKIAKVERDEIIEQLLKDFINNNLK